MVLPLQRPMPAPQPRIGEIIAGATPASGPGPAMPTVTAPSAAGPAPEAGGGFMENVQGLIAMFERPDIQAGLLQAGIRLMQPIPPGQTLLGHTGVAIGEGAEAITRTRALTAEEQRKNQEADLAERRTVVQERQATTGERAEERLAKTSEARIELSKEELAQTRELAERRMALRREIADEADDARRAQLIQQMTIAQNEIESRERIVREQVKSRLEIADENRAARIATAAINIAPFTNAPIGQLIDNARDAMAAMTGGGQALREAFPDNPADIPDADWDAIVKDPRKMFLLDQLYGDNEATANLLMQKLREARVRAQGSEEK